jgi:hypothetical protein
MAAPQPGPPEIDFSLESWIMNTRSVLFQPFSIALILGLLILGTFAEVAPRESILFLDNVVGKAVLFAAPFLMAYLVDWATGLLAAVVALILYVRIQKPDRTEGFVSESETSNGLTTKLVSSTNRWFVERVLGEQPVAITDDRVITRAVSDQDNRTNSSSSMNNSGPSDSSN